uniref:Uncharacterized protein n=1 Tax=Oryzias latipes TaxID=8090 RepID=A0A3P9LT58_ORYLA
PNKTGMPSLWGRWVRGGGGGVLRLDGTSLDSSIHPSLLVPAPSCLWDWTQSQLAWRERSRRGGIPLIHLGSNKRGVNPQGKLESLDKSQSDAAAPLYDPPRTRTTQKSAPSTGVRPSNVCM